MLINFPEWTIFFCTASLIRCLLVALIFTIVILVFGGRRYRCFNLFSLRRWYFVRHVVSLCVEPYLLWILAIILISIIVTLSTIPIELFYIVLSYCWLTEFFWQQGFRSTTGIFTLNRFFCRLLLNLLLILHGLFSELLSTSIMPLWYILYINLWFNKFSLNADSSEYN